jgi:hypothetical protein
MLDKSPDIGIIKKLPFVWDMLVGRGNIVEDRVAEVVSAARSRT